MKFFAGLILCCFFAGIATQEEVLDVLMPDEEFDEVLQGGSLDGFFKYSEFWEAMQAIRNDPENQRFVTPPLIIGHTFEKRNLLGFYLTSNTHRLEEHKKSKNIIFFTSLHHAREPLSLTMTLLIVRNCLRELRLEGQSKLKDFFRDNIIFFVPVVNTDSYIFINKHFYDTSMPGAKMIRKNRNVHPKCNELAGGVDLNRNYDFQFAANEKGSSADPCKEDYRGPHPFSEPETQAIHEFVNRHPNVVVEVNIHTFGNTWIIPFSFVSDKTNHYLQVKRPLFYDFYNEFEESLKKRNMHVKFGNASFTLDYPTNGNAGDWFTAKKNILNLDVELGNSDPQSDQFYPPQDILASIVNYNWKVMKLFLEDLIIDLRHKVIIFKDRIRFEIQNTSVSALRDFSAFFELKSYGAPLGGYQLFYSVKSLMSDPIPQKEIHHHRETLTLDGRHILEIDVVFENNDDMNNLAGLKMKVHRSFENEEDLDETVDDCTDDGCPNEDFVDKDQSFFFMSGLNERRKIIL